MLRKPTFVALVLVSLLAVLMTVSSSNYSPAVQAAGPTWDRFGNNIGPTMFLGSTNNQPLVFKTASIERMRITPSGNVGIGTETPANNAMLELSSEDPVRKVRVSLAVARPTKATSSGVAFC